MNRTKKFAMNSLVSALSQIVVLIVGFITPRIMIQTYGSEINGLVSSLHQIISYISLVEAGIGGAAIFSLYKPLANKDHSGINRILAAAKKSYSQAGYVFSAGIFIVAVIYAFIQSSESLSFFTIFILALVSGANGCCDFFLVSGRKVILTADQRNFVLSGIGIIQTIIRTVIICLLAYFKVDVVLVYTLALLPLIFKVFAILKYTKKKYPFINYKVEPDKEALNKRWDVIFQQILGTVQVGAPAIIATFLLSLSYVSVYTVHNMVVAGINSLLSIFIVGLPSGFGELIAKNEQKTLQKSVSEFEVAYNYVLSIVYGLTFVLIIPFVSIYTKNFTDFNYYDPLFAVTIVLNGLLYNIKTPQSMLIQSAGMYKETRYRVMAQGILLIVFGLIFGYFWGLAGIMLGSCVSNLYRTIDLFHFVPKYITHVKARTSIFRAIGVLFNIAIIILPSLFIKIELNGYIDWIIYALVYAVYSVIVVTLSVLVFDRKVFFNVFKRFKNLF